MQIHGAGSRNAVRSNQADSTSGKKALVVVALLLVAAIIGLVVMMGAPEKSEGSGASTETT